MYAADGKSVFYTRNVTPGPIFEYAQDSTQGIFEIERYDLETGETTTAVSGYGGAVRPTPSPNGKSIAFVRRDKDQSQLWVKDFASGRERMVYGDLDMDVQETWAVTGVYPNMDWTPDSRSIVFWAGGKIRRVDADGSGLRELAFTIDDTRGVADSPHPVIEVAPEKLHHQHSEIRERFTRWAACRVRNVGQAVYETRERRRTTAVHARGRHGDRGISKLVARWIASRFRALDR